MFRNTTSPPSLLRGALLGLATLCAATTAQAQTAYGLSINTTGAYGLVTFQATAPGTFTATTAITGLTTGQSLVGIDSRPATGQVYALGYNTTSSLAQIYTLNPTTGILTAVGTGVTLALGTSANRIGFDFNPTVDRIRVTAANRADFRLNPDTGALVATDGTLTYATTDTNAAQTPGVGSSAYTNSYIGSSTTTLYNIDDAASRLVTQNPPNNGTLNTVGALGVTVSDATLQVSDLDIYFNPTTGVNTAYLSVATASPTTFSVASTLYTVNLTTGVATSVGTLGNNTLIGIADITFAITRPATLPAITGNLAYALAGTNLLTFDTSNPSLIRTAIGITGVDATQTLVGLDVRPLNNSLYGLGYNAAAATGVANTQIYSINAVTGVAVSLGAAFRLELGTGAIGFDFNPTVDRIRVVGANRNNYRLNPLNGTLAATDGVVAYTTGTNTPTIGAVAYTNSFAGSTTTALYNYDQALNLLNIQATANPPADGQLTTVGSSGIVVNTTTPVVDFDIYSPSVGVNTAYLVANTGAATSSSFYTVNLATGAATLVGTVGNGFVAARNIAVAAATGVVTGTRPAEQATSLALYPNPLASATTVSFGLPRAAHVELVVTDALGRVVDKLDAGQLAAGTQSISWSRKGQAAGIYFFRLSFDGQPAGTRQGVLTQ